MPYALRFDGVNDVVTIPNGMSGNIGTSAYSFRVKSGPDGITLPATLNRGFIGATLASASGLVVTSGGLIEVWRVGTKLYGSSVQRLFTGVPFDFTLSHLADGTWTITDNLTSTVTDSGTYTNNITWSGSGVLNQLGKNSSNANNSCLAGDIVLIAVTGLLNADTWDADLSGGSGSVLPSVSGTNNGTLVNFTVPACWIFYSSGGTAYADTLLSGSYAHSGSLLNSAVGYSSALQAGSYTHSGSALGSAVGYSSTLQGGVFSYSGSELQSIISNGAQNYSDTLLGGAFTHSGSALQSSVARNSTLLAGSYSHSGSNLTASLAFYSALNGGAYSHFGSMLQSTISGQVTVSIGGYTITFAADDVSGAFAADTVAATFINDYVSATWSN